MAQKIIYIYYKPVEEKDYFSVTNDLYWYDYSEKDIKKRMKKYKGGRMSFEYDYKEKKMKPKILELNKQKSIKTNNKKQIMEWVIKNEYFLNIRSINEDNEKVYFIVDEKDVSFVESVLENTDFDYEVF